MIWIGTLLLALWLTYAAPMAPGGAWLGAVLLLLVVAWRPGTRSRLWLAAPWLGGLVGATVAGFVQRAVGVDGWSSAPVASVLALAILIGFCVALPLSMSQFVWLLFTRRGRPVCQQMLWRHRAPSRPGA